MQRGIFMFDKKKKKIISAVIAVILVASMVLGCVAALL